VLISLKECVGNYLIIMKGQL